MVVSLKTIRSSAALLVLLLSGGQAIAVGPADTAKQTASEYQRARYSAIHFKPAISGASNADCLACHAEVLKPTLRERSPAGVKASDSKAWYQQMTTYLGGQDTFHRRHLETEFARTTMSLHDVYPGAYGTNDAAVYDPVNKVLHVIDLKYGAGIYVSARNNPQLRYYALGALLELQKEGYEVETVVMTIVQPRCTTIEGPARSETIDAVDLMEFAADLVMYAKRTAEPNAPLKAGDHCRFCPAINLCPVVQNVKQMVAKSEFAAATAPTEGTVPPHKLAEYLKAVPLLKTMDTIKLAGGEPANFLDIGGGATPERVAKAFRLVMSYENVQAILVNIFAGINRCDWVAEGVVQALTANPVDVPVIVRLAGTNVEAGQKILANSGLPILRAGSLMEAAERAVTAWKNDQKQNTKMRAI